MGEENGGLEKHAGPSMGHRGAAMIGSDWRAKYVAQTGTRHANTAHPGHIPKGSGCANTRGMVYALSNGHVPLAATTDVSS